MRQALEQEIVTKGLADIATHNERLHQPSAMP